MGPMSDLERVLRKLARLLQPDDETAADDTDTVRTPPSDPPEVHRPQPHEDHGRDRAAG